MRIGSAPLRVALAVAMAGTAAQLWRAALDDRAAAPSRALALSSSGASVALDSQLLTRLVRRNALSRVEARLPGPAAPPRAPKLRVAKPAPERPHPVEKARPTSTHVALTRVSSVPVATPRPKPSVPTSTTSTPTPSERTLASSSNGASTPTTDHGKKTLRQLAQVQKPHAKQGHVDPKKHQEGGSRRGRQKGTGHTRATEHASAPSAPEESSAPPHEKSEHGSKKK